jgi:hypothetical protein
VWYPPPAGPVLIACLLVGTETGVFTYAPRRMSRHVSDYVSGTARASLVAESDGSGLGSPQC